MSTKRILNGLARLNAVLPQAPYAKFFSLSRLRSIMSKQIIAPYRKSGSLVFLSGVTGEPGDAKTQVVNAFEKVRQRLKEAGTSIENTISVVIYLANLNDRETALNPIWEELFPANPPARTTVEVGLGKGRLVEIQAIAQMPLK